MKGITTIFALAICLLASIQPSGVSAQRRGINIRLGDILREMRDRGEIERQIACIVGQGPCNERGQMLRNIIPDIASNGRCYVCSRDDERKIRLVLATLQNRHPRCWFVLIEALQRRVANPPSALGCTS